MMKRTIPQRNSGHKKKDFLLKEWWEKNAILEDYRDAICRLTESHAVASLLVDLEKAVLDVHETMGELAAFGIKTNKEALAAINELEQKKAGAHHNIFVV